MLPLLAAAKMPSAKSIMTLVVIALGVGIILMIYASGRKIGKLKEASKHGKDAEFPTNGAGIPDGWSPNGIVAQLYTAMKGADMFFSNDDKKMVYGALVSLSSDQVVAVYNQFNRLYGESENGKYKYTLYNWIYDDSGDESKQKALATLEREGLR